MSHNEQKIGTAKPTIAGVITPSLSDLSDVSASSPNANDTLQYSGGSWSPVASSGLSASTQYIYVGSGESNDYANTGNTGAVSVGDYWYVYDSSPAENISGASLNKVSGTNWVESVSLPAGHYVIEAQFHSAFTASGGLTLRAQTTTGSVLSAAAFIGADLSTDPQASLISARFEITSAMVSSNANKVALKVYDASNVAGYTGTTPTQGNTPSEYTYIYLRKVQ